MTSGWLSVFSKICGESKMRCLICKKCAVKAARHYAKAIRCTNKKNCTLSMSGGARAVCYEVNVHADTAMSSHFICLCSFLRIIVSELCIHMCNHNIYVMLYNCTIRQT